MEECPKCGKLTLEAEGEFSCKLFTCLNKNCGYEIQAEVEPNIDTDPDPDIREFEPVKIKIIKKNG